MPDTDSQPRPPHTSRGRRPGRPGRGGRGQARAAHLGTEPARQPSVAEPRQAGASPSLNSLRGNRRGRSGPGRVASRDPPRRAFGGHLTGAQDAEHALSPDAPEFVPGQSIALRPRGKGVKLPKSTAVDLGTRIHEDISNLNYECAVCTDDVLRTSRIWSCSLCWTVVHLKCAKRWHDNQKQAQSEPPESTWRCPGCNSKLLDSPGPYHCWCGKELNPCPASAALPPHSCGQTCAKPRPGCPHVCALMCHSGPCPPCGVMGPAQSCFCGKNTSQKLCRETDYENGWSCQELCQDLLPCEHTCPKPCHAGLCGGCEVPIHARCYCGQVEKQMPCHELEPLQSFDATKGWFEGSFTCGNQITRKFDCGLHDYSSTCSTQAQESPHCPFADVETCPCGKTALDQLLERPRNTCEDLIPHCEKPCLKQLPCQHQCKRACHSGDCGTCFETIDVACRCGKAISSSMCHQGDIQHPLCRRKCSAILHCGRHRHGMYCCPSEKTATERQAARKRNRATDWQIEPEHICVETCGRLLNCKKHQCQMLCHRGECSSCLEAIFEDMSCACGSSVLKAPIPCGSQPPACRFPCQRQPFCGHAAVEHNCHPDDVSCPKCPYLVEMWCACGKEKLKNQPCHLRAAYCGQPCGRKLGCGLHSCTKSCHSGACDGLESAVCDQICGKTKLLCSHQCRSKCHGKPPCDESAPCAAKLMVHCPCGLRKQELRCLACLSNPTPERPGGVKCDDECLRLQRNARLAAALNVDPSHTNDHVPYSDTTLRLFRENVAWAETQERELRVFAKSTDVRMRFKPMSSSKSRQFLHVLANDFGLESQSEDVEPHRHVVVFKGRSVSPPTKTLRECIKIRDAQAEAMAARPSPGPVSEPLNSLAMAAARPSPGPVSEPLNSLSMAAARPSPGPVSEPLNSLLLTSARFGLTEDEVKTTLESDLAAQPMRFTFSFLPSDEVLMRAKTSYSAFLSPAAMEQALQSLRPRLAKTVEQTGLAGNVIVCHADSDEHVSRRGTATDGGWSAVVAGRAVRPETRGAEGPATSGGRKLLGLRKKADKPQGKTWDTLEGDVEC